MIHQLTDKVWAVEVPEWANAYKAECIPQADFYELFCYELGEYDEPIKEDSITLPHGHWRYICTSKEVTEEQAAGIVEKARLRGNIRYTDYSREYMWQETALESLNSLLASKGLDVNKNYCLIEKM